MRDGLSSWCRRCHADATRRYREANREELNARRRVVPTYTFNPKRMKWEPNADPRPKSKLR
jgi:hypothetical protein